MIRKALFGNLLALLAASLAGGAEPEVVQVEPADLLRRADLIGRRVAVDDRVSFIATHDDRDYDEVQLKRTPILFRISHNPRRLRLERLTQPPAARVEGVLKREGGRIVCDVTGLVPYPTDLQRLDQGVKALGGRDAEGRVVWARWAERRGKDFQDEVLRERARTLEAEAVRIEAEAETERPSADPPRRWLELARRARDRQVREPEPSALAHRAFTLRLASADRLADLQALVQDIEAFWPGSPAPPAAEADLGPWQAPYANDPAAAYRLAPGPVRAALDHRLWSEASLRLAGRRMDAEPGRALELAQEAAKTHADRPEDVRRLLERGLTEATRDLSALRKKDVEALARAYRETMQRPDAARDLQRRWLDDQRLHRLSSTDAEGRVILADQYEALLDDREAAVALLLDAWKIDPQSKEVADAFRRRGFRKENDRWVEATHPGPGALTAADPDPNTPSGPSSPLRSNTLRGLTPQQVRARLGGKPDQVVWSASQGQLIEQWIYRGASQDQYINFLRAPGDPLPKVVAYYARPRHRLDESHRPR